jgi:exosortase A-associated hydrolase 1
MNTEKHREWPVTFDCDGEALVGITAVPPRPAEVGVVIVVGGPQYRIGAHRQFVLLARNLADAGFATLRFDCRGMGDSTGAMRSFDDFDKDIGSAIGALQAAVPAVARVVLWGLCDAASASLLYWERTRDTRVAGLALVNPWIRSQVTIARTTLKHYYARRLAEKEFWNKALHGGVDLARAMRGFAQTVRDSASRVARARSPTVAFQERMATGWAAYPGPILLILSGQDLTAREFLEYAATNPRMRGLVERSNVERHDMPSADHTFSSSESHRIVEQRTAAWIRDVVLGESRRPID